MSNKKCQHCGGTDIDVDPARGDAVCTSCGSVLEDTIIVSEVQFEENSYGGSTALGQFVSSDSRGLSGFATAYRGGGGKESREITIRRARERITDLAQKLRLNQHCTDTACNFFKMALAGNLTYGRRSAHVVAACIYITCRLEGTPHLLIDIADELQINVHTLGHTFMKLAQALCLRIPSVDPCLYILRFANSLGFQDKAHEVSMTAIRLVQRMKRDWIHTGRRPSGLCGAALLIAARLHDFSRSVKDIIKVVKVHEFTLRKRLNEFGETPSSSLTLDEFLTVDLEEEHDPPAFKASRKKDRDKLAKLIEEDGQVSDEISNLQKEIDRQLEERRAKMRGPWAKYAKDPTTTATTSSAPEEPQTEDAVEAEDVEKFLAEDTAGLIQSCLEGDQENVTGEVVVKENLESILMPPPDSTYLQMRHNLRPTMASLGIKTDYSKEKGDEQAEGSGELTLEDIDDEEIDSYLMTPKEIGYKTEMWMKLNGDFLKEQEEKRAKKLQEEEESGKFKKKRNTRRARNGPVANTPAEAIEKMLQEKKISSKINYDVLRSLSSTSTAAVDEGASTSAPSTPFTPSPLSTPSTSNALVYEDRNIAITAFTASRKRPITDPPVRNVKGKLKSEKTGLEVGKQKPKSEKKPEEKKDVKEDKPPPVAPPQESTEEAVEETEEVVDSKEMSTAEMLRQMRGEEEEYEEEYY